MHKGLLDESHRCTENFWVTKFDKLQRFWHIFYDHIIFEKYFNNELKTTTAQHKNSAECLCIWVSHFI